MSLRWEGNKRALLLCRRMSGGIAAGEYVFSDPIAFRHLAQEDGTDIVEENVVIEGYQVYIVEQWACSRTHPVFVVTTFTGDESNNVRPDQVYRGSLLVVDRFRAADTP